MTEIDRLTLVLGGARSGKSRYAEELVTALPAPWVYLATAEPQDAEMRERIKAHQARRGDGWITLEEPLQLASVLENAPASAPLLVDCLTLWLTNLMLSTEDIDGAAAALLEAIQARPGRTIMVSNEVGLGIVPDTTLGRDFRDEAGRLNQLFAARAARVVMMIAGLPLTLKPSQSQT